MSITNGTHLDLEIIAGILGPEDLDPPLLNRGDHAHPIKVDEETQTIGNQVTVANEQMTQEEQENDAIPGLEILPVQENEDAAMNDKKKSNAVATTSTLGDLGGTALDSILAKHGLQTVTSDSEDNETSEEDSSTSETDSDSSDSDTDSASSSSSEDLALQGTSSRLKSQHKRNKEKLEEMVQENGDSEEDINIPSGSQPLSMFATAHEIIAPQVTMPSITEVSDEEPIEIIGEVMSIVDSVIVVKSLNNGMQRVLDTDSLLVLENRKVLGLIFETFGPLTAPLYSIRFPSAAHFPSDLSAFLESPKQSLKVYYCPSRSTFAYTSKLMQNKGNDASNIYDEEVAEDELEFSDDEAEKEWKRLHDKGSKRKRGASSRAGSTYSESPRLGGRSSLPYGDETDDAMSVGDVALSYADPYDDEPGNLPSASNESPLNSPISPLNSGSLPSRPNDNRGAHGGGRGRGRPGRGRGNFSGDRRGGSGPIRGRGRQPPSSNMPPPVMNGYHGHTEYDPTFSVNISPNYNNHVPHPVPPGGVYPYGGGYTNAPYMGAGTFMGAQVPPQAFGMPNMPVHMNNAMHVSGASMHPMGAGPGMPPVMGGPAPGAFVNPRFAMMQLMSPGGMPNPNGGPYGNDPQNGRQNPPQ